MYGKEYIEWLDYRGGFAAFIRPAKQWDCPDARKRAYGAFLPVADAIAIFNNDAELNASVSGHVE